MQPAITWRLSAPITEAQVATVLSCSTEVLWYQRVKYVSHRPPRPVWRRTRPSARVLSCVLRRPPHLSKTTPRCLGIHSNNRECRHILCDECKEEQHFVPLVN